MFRNNLNNKQIEITHKFIDSIVGARNIWIKGYLNVYTIYKHEPNILHPFFQKVIYFQKNIYYLLVNIFSQTCPWNWNNFNSKKIIYI